MRNPFKNNPMENLDFDFAFKKRRERIQFQFEIKANEIESK